LRLVDELQLHDSKELAQSPRMTRASANCRRASAYRCCKLPDAPAVNDPRVPSNDLRPTSGRASRGARSLPCFIDVTSGMDGSHGVDPAPRRGCARPLAGRKESFMLERENSFSARRAALLARRAAEMRAFPTSSEARLWSALRGGAGWGCASCRSGALGRGWPRLAASLRRSRVSGSRNEPGDGPPKRAAHPTASFRFASLTC
jgi:hypothetical protein